MNVIRVAIGDLSIIKDILTNHIDASDKRVEPPSQGHLEALLNDDKAYLFAAIQDDKVTGYTLAYRFPSLYASEYLAYLYDIEVTLQYRRQGIGRLLIETLLAHLKTDGVNEIWLGTAIDNVAGHALFHSTGAFRSEETFNDYTYYLN